MKICVVGNGVAGIHAALVARQRDAQAKIQVISGETDFFFSRTALMYAFMDQMNRRDLEPFERSTYGKQNIQLTRDWVDDVDAGKHRLKLRSGGEVAYDKLVLAVGASPNMFPWEGADRVKDGLVHFVSMQDLDACERLAKTAKRAVVVGGGLIGIELVECLVHHRIPTTFLIREPYYWPMALGEEEATYVSRHMREHGVDVRLGDEMTRIHTNDQGTVISVDTRSGDSLPCDVLGICAGVRPNVASMKAWTTPPEIGRGIVVNDTLETSLPDVFACGDCAEIHPEGGKPFGELIWYSAKRQGELVGRNLFDDAVAYAPPMFFNSSKFFEIEYTTVGDVMKAPAGSPTLYRKDPKRAASQRIVHDGEKVLGFNMLGSRWNHEILERWVHERRSLQFVRTHLEEAQYDVEFGRSPLKRYEETELPLTPLT